MPLKSKPPLPDLEIASYAPDLFCLNPFAKKRCKKKNEEIDKHNEQTSNEFRRQLAEYKSSKSTK